MSRFYGIVVAMFYNDHDPAHFHARYGKEHVLIAIESLSVLRGRLPARALGLVMEWAAIHNPELMENWNLARAREPLNPIEPLK